MVEVLTKEACGTERRSSNPAVPESDAISLRQRNLRCGHRGFEISKTVEPCSRAFLRRSCGKMVRPYAPFIVGFDGSISRCCDR